MNVVKEFEKLTGCKGQLYKRRVKRKYHIQNLSAARFSYDVVVPSDYMIDKLIDLYCYELDYKNIPNMKYVDKKFQKLFMTPTKNTAFAIMLEQRF